MKPFVSFSSANIYTYFIISNLRHLNKSVYSTDLLSFKEWKIVHCDMSIFLHMRFKQIWQIRFCCHLLLLPFGSGWTTSLVFYRMFKCRFALQMVFNVVKLHNRWKQSLVSSYFWCKSRSMPLFSKFYLCSLSSICVSEFNAWVHALQTITVLECTPVNARLYFKPFAA